MSIYIKVCGLKSRTDVAAAVEAGADAVGFVFYDASVRNVTPQQALDASAELPARIRRVAVMKNPSVDACTLVLKEFGPDVLQTDVDDFEYLEVPDSVERWPVYREGSQQPATDGTYIYEGQKSGHGETVDWTAAREFSRRGRMILAGGLAPSNVALAISSTQPFGVDVSSGVELAPGRKDPRLIAEFVSAAKAAGNTL